MRWLKKPLFLIWLFHKKLFKYGLIFIASFLILTLVLSASLTGFLYYANKHGQLQTWLNRSLGSVHISYQAAKVSWRHVDPTIQLTGIEITDDAALKTPVQLNSASVSLGIWTSILRWNLVTDNITLSGLNFDVVQNSDGSFHLVGLRGSGSQSYTISPTLSKWFLDQGGIHLNDVTANLSLRNGQNLTLNVNHLDWSHTFDYYLNFDGSISQIPASEIKFNANLVPGENPLDLNDWGVQFNGSFTGKDFTPLFAKQRFYDFAWVSGGGELDFEGSYHDQSLQNLSIYVSLNNLNLSHSTAKNIISNQLDEIITWQALTNGGWQIHMKPMDDQGATSSHVDIRYTPNEPMIWNMSADNIDLQLIGQWVEFWFPPTSYTGELWATLKPAGMIRSLKVASGNSAGNIDLEGKNLSAGANPVFPKGWPPANIRLKASWQLGGGNLAAITISQFLMQNAWINLAVSGTAVAPQKDPKNPLLNLSGTVSAKNLDVVKDYYIPHEGVSHGLTEWLTQGLVKLPVVTGSFIVKGPLDDLPYANGKGQFKIALQTQNATVSPWVNWPLITDVTANVLFNNQELTIDANQVKTTGVAVNKVHFVIDDLRPKFIKDIVITGTSKPTARQGLDYLAAMPITSEKVNAWLKRQTVTGVLPVNLQIVIPIHEEHEPITVTGAVTFNGNDWSFNPEDAPFFSNITGQMTFINDEFSSNGLDFTALNQPLHATISQSPIDNLSVLVQSLSFLGQTFTGLGLNVDSRGPYTTLNITNPLANGSLTIQDEDQKVVAHFKDFHLPVFQNSATQTDIPNAERANPADNSSAILLGQTLSHAPALDITIDELDYGKSNIGQFYWQSVPLPNGIQIQHINLTSKAVSLTTTARIKTVNSQDRFKVQGTLSSDNYGDLLTDLNYPGVVNGGSGDITFNFKFLGPILKPDFSSLNGSLGFKLADGKLLKVNTGIARIFGLVSLDTIFSTLSFNFEKMMSNGLAFDSLEGTYNIQNGIATTQDKGIKIEGPSLNMTLTGQMDLVNQTLNQKAVVMPQVGTSIAIAAAFVGGPIIGAATFFADKLLGNTIFRNAGLLTYQITGTFDDPKVSLFKNSNT